MAIYFGLRSGTNNFEGLIVNSDGAVTPTDYQSTLVVDQSAVEFSHDTSNYTENSEFESDEDKLWRRKPTVGELRLTVSKLPYEVNLPDNGYTGGHAMKLPITTDQYVLDAIWVDEVSDKVATQPMTEMESTVELENGIYRKSVWFNAVSATLYTRDELDSFGLDKDINDKIIAEVNRLGPLTNNFRKKIGAIEALELYNSR